MVINVELGQLQLGASEGRVLLMARGPHGEPVTFSLAPAEAGNVAYMLPDYVNVAARQVPTGPLAKMAPLFGAEEAKEG